ncbi:hypothetical protein BDZ89DRAFT_1061967 [Hymenopellis radicata]|nr:hypothetical protein BDZ89DRAFT_1061967 [Hymenopellis radicata]
MEDINKRHGGLSWPQFISRLRVEFPHPNMEVRQKFEAGLTGASKVKQYHAASLDISS